MEKVALNNVQLDRLADSQPTLKPCLAIVCRVHPTRKVPWGTSWTPTEKSNRVGIGWRCGRATTNARSWTVMLCHWKPTRRPNPCKRAWIDIGRSWYRTVRVFNRFSVGVAAITRYFSWSIVRRGRPLMSFWNASTNTITCTMVIKSSKC